MRGSVIASVPRAMDRSIRVRFITQSISVFTAEKSWDSTAVSIRVHRSMT